MSLVLYQDLQEFYTKYKQKCRDNGWYDIIQLLDPQSADIEAMNLNIFSNKDKLA